MTHALARSEAPVLNTAPKPLASAPRPVPMLPWRDPQTAAPEDVQACIARLEEAVLANPESPDLRTCLGLAYAVNHDVYKCMDTLETALALDPDHFWARLKSGELQYRLRALNRAEEETLRAVDSAETPWQHSLARKQLQEIRSMKRSCLRNIDWTKPFARPMVLASTMVVLVAALMLWK